MLKPIIQKSREPDDLIFKWNVLSTRKFKSVGLTEDTYIRRVYKKCYHSHFFLIKKEETMMLRVTGVTGVPHS